MPEAAVTLFASVPSDAIPLNRCPAIAGVPFARGALRDVCLLGARRPDGSAMPIQAQALDYWTDGSVRWALVSLQIGTSTTHGPVAECGAVQHGSHNAVGSPSSARSPGPWVAFVLGTPKTAHTFPLWVVTTHSTR